jgi:photosystem II stability/assembly factor-like uncharacterized protein
MKVIPLLFSVTALSIGVSGQSFQNLGFDDANTNNIVFTMGPYGPLGSGPTTDLLPGWEVFAGTNSVSIVGVNDMVFTSSYLSLVSASSTFALAPCVGGSYAFIQSDTSNVPCSLIQRGDVPRDAEVVSYKFSADPFGLEIDGQTILPLAGSLPYALAGPKLVSFNVSKFSGQNVQLKLTQVAMHPTEPGVHIASFLDSIVFRKASPTDLWFPRDTGDVQNDLLAAAASSNALVVVGRNGTILSSTDGYRWLKVPSATTNILKGVVFGNGVWVAVGNNGTILTSPDAQQWTLRGTNTNVGFSAVTYAQGVFVAVGSQPSSVYPVQAAVWTSPDAVAWTDRSPPSAPGIYNGAQYAVVYAPEKQAFVSVGETVLASNDGKTWFALNSRTTPYAQSLAYGGGKFVAVGDAGIYTSTNALDWSQPNLLVSSVLNTVAYFDGVFWAAGPTTPTTTNDGVIFRSADGNVWSPVDVPAAPEILGIWPAGNSLLAVGRNGTILQSGSAVTPPQFRTWTTRFLSDGSLALTLDAPPGGVLSIEMSPDFKTWSLLQTITNTTPRVDITDHEAKGAGSRFYRARAD